jgi:hypothetical protein
MSKKTRSRRSAQSSQRGASPSGARPSGASQAVPGRARREQAAPDQTEADAIVRRVLGDLWKAVAAGEPLQAEIESSTCMEIPRVLGVRDVAEEEQFRATVLVEGARRRRNPDGAALLRLLMAMGTAATKRAASRALAEMTGEGVYPPEWVTEIGKAAPGRAWRRYDVFGDDEAVAVTFTYGEAEHGILVQVDLAGIPVAIAAGVSSRADRLIEAITGGIGEEGGLGEFDRSETISLADARRRIAGPLDRMDRDPAGELSNSTLAFLPLVRSRVRRLPAEGAEPVPEFTAADRAAAVDEFLKSPQAAEAVADAVAGGPGQSDAVAGGPGQSDAEDSIRFWAEVLTGYSGRRPGEAPDQVGPRKLAHILLGHVPNTFVLSPGQRDHLEPAVTAWVRWSADRRELGEAATAVLMERVPQVLSRFGQAYDDPDAVAIRGYASGLAASDADVAWLSDQVGRRMFALPLPEQHGPLDLADPADRHRLVAEEFGPCTPPSPMTSEEFIEAAYRVVEDLWRDEESPAYQAARRMFDDGVARHDIIHRLAGTPAPTIGSSIVR